MSDMPAEWVEDMRAEHRDAAWESHRAHIRPHTEYQVLVTTVCERLVTVEAADAETAIDTAIQQVRDDDEPGQPVSDQGELL